MNHATTSDVETILLRTMTDAESELAARLLTLAASTLRARIKKLDLRMGDDLDFAEIVNYVEASAVARIVRNPEGITSEGIGPYTVNRVGASSGFEFTAAELAQLGIGSGAFSIAPYLASPQLAAGVVPPWYFDFPTGDGSL